MLFICMLTAIQLDGQLSLMTVKVYDIRADGVLSSELHSKQVVIAKTAPKQFFRLSLPLP